MKHLIIKKAKFDTDYDRNSFDKLFFHGYFMRNVKECSKVIVEISLLHIFTLKNVTENIITYRWPPNNVS